VIQPVLPLHEYATEPLQDVAESIADPSATEAAADPAAIESIAKPLHSVDDPAGFGAALTETFCLCVQV
jgi:hypothetical protein